ncbi:MAG: hypothetical protein JW395_0544 [Nitrospira sp.]|nr:hypothetical protein [Nitrospira sp.]
MDGFAVFGQDAQRGGGSGGQGDEMGIGGQGGRARRHGGRETGDLCVGVSCAIQNGFAQSRGGAGQIDEKAGVIRGEDVQRGLDVRGVGWKEGEEESQGK